MKRQRPTSYWDDIANASNTLAKLTEQQTQHMELVKQIEKVTGKNIYEHNMSKWWDTICTKVKKCHETQQLMSSALLHSNHIMGVLHEQQPSWTIAVNRTMFQLANVLEDLHNHPEWFETLTGELPKVTHESEEWRHSIINSLRTFLTTEPPSGG